MAPFCRNAKKRRKKVAGEKSSRLSPLAGRSVRTCLNLVLLFGFLRVQPTPAAAALPQEKRNCLEAQPKPGLAWHARGPLRTDAVIATLTNVYSIPAFPLARDLDPPPAITKARKKRKKKKEKARKNNSGWRSAKTRLELFLYFSFCRAIKGARKSVSLGLLLFTLREKKRDPSESGTAACEQRQKTLLGNFSKSRSRLCD